ncbi:unnamed protein product [Effrenium voratum]|uniref:Uncharacterized protein n=1 Tax=Effrenium voratum TaxID=2562239 RepID=A0AA36IWJ9_9DINO|nr:unnamed protein product [Effrenium voratum]
MARVLAPEELPAEPQVPCRVAVSPRPMTPPRSAGGAAWASPPSVLHLPGQCAGFAQARLGSTSILRLPGDAANRSLSRPRAKQEDARYVTPGNCMTAASLKE